MAKRTSSRRNCKRRSSTFEFLESRRLLATVAGTVYEDANGDGVMDFGEDPLSGVLVYLDDNSNGRLDRQGFGLDADSFQNGQVLNNVSQVVFPSATGSDNRQAFRVRALRSVDRASTGELVFGNDTSIHWGLDRRLRFDFTLPVDSLSLDAIGTSGTAFANVRLDAYSSSDELLESVGIDGLENTEMGRFAIERPVADIRYVVAYVAGGRGTATFDNLRADDVGDERATLSSSEGFYRLTDVTPGDVVVAQQVPDGYEQTVPLPDLSYRIRVDDAVSNLNFGNRTASISGVAFSDGGIIGVYEPIRDDSIDHVPLFLDVNGNGIADPLNTMVDPDAFLEDLVLDFVSGEVTLSTVTSSNAPTFESVIAAADALVSPDGQLFTHELNAAWSNDRRLRFDFTAPASFVSLDFIGAANGETEVGTLIAYSVAGVEIASTTTQPLAAGQRETMTISRRGFDIGYVVAYTIDSPVENGRLDNFQATTTSEPVTFTNADGEYQFKPLATGNHRIRPLPVSGKDVSFPIDGVYNQELEVGDHLIELNFGFVVNNEPPRTKGDAATTVEDTPITIAVLLNDSDSDGVLNQGSVKVTREPTKGTTEVTSQGQIIYMPDPDFAGTDTFLYTVGDDQATESNASLVTVTVEPVNDRPKARDDNVSVLTLGSTTIGVLTNDVDVDSSLVPSSVTIVSSPRNGAASVDPNTGNIIYTSTTGNADTLTYTVQDEQGLTSLEATVTIAVLATGTGPVARDDSESLLEGTRVSLPVLANDTDADGSVDPGSIVIVTRPGRGAATINGDGFIDYRPILGYVGEDTFDYIVRDDAGLSSNPAKVTLTIRERDFPYQNPINNLDTNADGFIIPRDALLIINEVNSRQISDPLTGAILANPAPGEVPVAYYDVTGDGFIAARDVLQIVIFINQQSAIAAAAAAKPPLAASAVAAIFAAFETEETEEDEEDA